MMMMNDTTHHYLRYRGWPIAFAGVVVLAAIVVVPVAIFVPSCE